MLMTNSCAGCGKTWTGLTVAHCGACHRTFAGTTLFDKHRAAYGERGVCRNPAEILDRQGCSVMVLREGQWRGPEADDSSLKSLKSRTR
jgi:hypothetical protein